MLTCKVLFWAALQVIIMLRLQNLFCSNRKSTWGVGKKDKRDKCYIRICISSFCVNCQATCFLIRACSFKIHSSLAPHGSRLGMLLSLFDFLLRFYIFSQFNDKYCRQFKNYIECYVTIYEVWDNHIMSIYWLSS